MPQSSVLTAFVNAFAGMNADSSDSTDNYITRVSAETSLFLPPGCAVMQGSADDTCVSLTTQTAQKILGIVAAGGDYPVVDSSGIGLCKTADSNGNKGLTPGTTVLIKVRGTIWVQLDEDVLPTSAVRVRVNAVGSGVGPGCFRKTASAGNTIDLSKLAKWQGSYLAASGIGMLRYDMLFSSNGAND